VKAGAAIALSNGNSKKLAIVADMEEIGLRTLEGDGATVEDASDFFSRIEEVAADEPEVGTEAFSLQYPDVYADLHGSDSYRDRHGHLEQLLICKFDPIGAGGAPLALGQSVYLARQFGYLADLTAYEELRIYLFLPAGETIGADAGFPLILAGSAFESLEITIPGTSIVEGWNEIAIDLEAPYRVRLNGTVAGEMSRTGSSNPLPHISEIHFGVLAETGSINSAFTFWFDEWHLGGNVPRHPGLEEKDTGWSYSHLLGIDTSLPFLPALEHSYQRTVGEASEVGLSASRYILDGTVMTRESLSFVEGFRYPQGLEQRYSYIRSWLYSDLETLLIDTPPSPIDSSLDLSVNQSHSGGISYFWDRNSLSLDLSREESYEVAAPAVPSTPFASYAEKMSTLFRPVEAAHPGAELEAREDRGELFVTLPRWFQ